MHPTREPRSAAARATADQATGVCVRAPGRLHFGFLDPAATLGRRFGSIGLVVDGFETALELAPASRDDWRVAATAASAVGDGDLARASAHLQRLRERTGWQQPLALRLLRGLPPHAGFGSGTQLALAVGHAFVALWTRAEPAAAGRPVPDSTTLAGWLGRGVRSGVGIAGFDAGGLLVDGGPAADGSPAPLLARLTLPANWRIVVVQDRAARGLSGGDEKRAIAELPPLSQAAAADICHQLLMRVLAGAASADIAAFAAGLTHIQQVLGAHFAPAQGGSAYSSPAVGAAMLRVADWQAAAPLRRHAGIGQSSWGPTAFAVVGSADAAEDVADAARDASRGELDVSVVRARDHGATFEDAPAAA